MTGMPAWNDRSDGQLWATVAFLEKLPDMSEQDYAGRVISSMIQSGGHHHSGNINDAGQPNTRAKP
jgi:hypothetical protein